MVTSIFSFIGTMFSKGFFTGSLQKSELWGNGLHSFLSCYLSTLPTTRHIHNFLSFTNVMYVCMMMMIDDDGESHMQTS